MTQRDIEQEFESIKELLEAKLYEKFSDVLSDSKLFEKLKLSSNPIKAPINYEFLFENKSDIHSVSVPLHKNFTKKKDEIIVVDDDESIIDLNIIKRSRPETAKSLLKLIKE